MSEWKALTLGHLSTQRKGINYKSEDYGDEHSGHPFITIKCFVKGGGYEPTGIKFYDGFSTKADHLPPGDLLFSVTDLTRAGDIVGSPLRVPDFGSTKPALASMDCMRIEPIANRCNKRFLYHRLMLSDVRRQMVAYAAGSTVLHLDTKKVPSITVRIPVDVNLQSRIADVLDGIDTAIEKTEALIAKYQQIKAGLMHDLFTRGVLPNGQLRPPREQAPELYQETAIGWIPREWQYELLDKLALRGSGHTPNKNFPEYWNGGIKWVSLADSHRLDQLYISDTELQISHKGIQNSSAVLHPAGIVVLSRDAGVGKSAITTEPMAVSQHFMCWKCDQKMDNHFLYYWLQFNKRTFENIAMGSTILTIGLPYFKKMKIACPIELEEQRNIAAKIKASDARIFSLQDELSKLKQQKQGLMHDLLTGKVPVTIENRTTTTEAVA
jgi:type I restriction enzyme S subunit